MERERGEMEREKVRALVNAPASSTRAQGVGLCVGRACGDGCSRRPRMSRGGDALVKAHAPLFTLLNTRASRRILQNSAVVLHVGACESAVVVHVGACDSVVHPLSVLLPYRYWRHSSL